MSDLATKMRLSLELLDASKVADAECRRAINAAIDKATAARNAAYVAMEATGLGARAISETLPKLPKRVEVVELEHEEGGVASKSLALAAIEREAAE